MSNASNLANKLHAANWRGARGVAHCCTANACGQQKQDFLRAIFVSFRFFVRIFVCTNSFIITVALFEIFLLDFPIFFALLPAG